jgi:hypothetical protein
MVVGPDPKGQPDAPKIPTARGPIAAMYQKAMHQKLGYLLLAGALLIGSACRTAPEDPMYYSHWNIGSLGPRAQYNFLGYDPQSDHSVWEHEAEKAEGIALTLRRHLLNDNPYNPLQYRRGWGDPYNVYNPTAAYADVYYLGRETVVWAAKSVATGVLIPADLLIGTTYGHFGGSWTSSGRQFDALSDPVDPEDFEVNNP